VKTKSLTQRRQGAKFEEESRNSRERSQERKKKTAPVGRGSGRTQGSHKAKPCVKGTRVQQLKAAEPRVAQAPARHLLGVASNITTRLHSPATSLGFSGASPYQLSSRSFAANFAICLSFASGRLCVRFSALNTFSGREREDHSIHGQCLGAWRPF
jgi:hypothetical protein